MRYTVQHDYGSYRDGQQFGRWEAGTEVELDEPDAEWILRDSPGALAPVQPKEGSTPPVPDPDAVPEGKAEVVLEWVGDDKDRAARALAAEQASDKPRSTLTAQLEKLANPA